MNSAISPQFPIPTNSVVLFPLGILCPRFLRFLGLIMSNPPPTYNGHLDPPAQLICYTPEKQPLPWQKLWARPRSAHAGKILGHVPSPILEPHLSDQSNAVRPGDIQGAGHLEICELWLGAPQGLGYRQAEWLGSAGIEKL